MLSKISFKAFLVVALSALATNVWSNTPVEGTHYTVNNPAGVAEKPLVVEFFSYNCPHCYSMERVLSDWKKSKDSQIEFERVPVFLPKLTQAFYAAEYLKVSDKVHSIIFHKFHAEKKPVSTIKAIKAVFAEAGIDEKTFNKAYKSFSVKSKTKKALKLAKKFKITSVPTFIVNNKYETSGTSAGSNEMLTEILSKLPLEAAPASKKDS